MFQTVSADQDMADGIDGVGDAIENTKISAMEMPCKNGKEGISYPVLAVALPPC